MRFQKLRIHGHGFQSHTWLGTCKSSKARVCGGSVNCIDTALACCLTHHVCSRQACNIRSCPRTRHSRKQAQAQAQCVAQPGQCGGARVAVFVSEWRGASYRRLVPTCPRHTLAVHRKHGAAGQCVQCRGQVRQERCVRQPVCDGRATRVVGPEARRGQRLEVNVDPFHVHPHDLGCQRVDESTLVLRLKQRPQPGNVAAVPRQCNAVQCSGHRAMRR